MVLSNFITHLIRISGRPVVTAGVYSRVTLAASTHRSHLSSIPFLLHHRFLAPLFFAHVRLPDNGIVSTLSQTFRDVFIVELYSSFSPLRFRSKTITHRLFQKQTRRNMFRLRRHAFARDPFYRAQTYDIFTFPPRYSRSR